MVNSRLKFRGKSIETGEWVYGYYVYTHDRHRIIYEDYEGFYCEEEVDPETVGQYIILKDKNVKEIYEGDIVSYFGLKYEVLFKNGAFGWMEDGEFYSFSEMTTSVFDEFEVIGNVYENPELLEESK